MYTDRFINVQRLVLPLLLVFLVQARAADTAIETPEQSNVLVRTDAFDVTVQDVELYLRALYREYDQPFQWGSTIRVEQAISDIFALKVLSREARAAGVTSAVPEAWLKEYLWSMQAVTLHVNNKVDAEMAAIDWEQQALEYFMVNRQDFVTEETLTIRTLLIRVDERNYVEAWQLAESLQASVMSETDFESLVAEYTEDEVAKKHNGLMEGLVRGQTVPEFEAAAFALSQKGEISPPVATQFGVHIIQLISRSQPRPMLFDEAKEAIVADLKVKRRAEIMEGFRSEARTREPAGFTIFEEAVADFLGRVTAESDASK